MRARYSGDAAKGLLPTRVSRSQRLASSMEEIAEEEVFGSRDLRPVVAGSQLASDSGSRSSLLVGQN